MSLSLTKLSCLLGLTLALTIALSSARPVRRQTFEVPKNHLISLITGRKLHVHDDGNVTVKHQIDNEYKEGRFYYNQNGDYITFQSADHNRSFLHFVEVLTSTNETRLEFSGYNETQYNATAADYNSTEEYASGGGNDTDKVPVLKLVFGELEDDEDGVIRHHMWVEERLAMNTYAYSVRPSNGTVCYLAFEPDGSPVSDPCNADLATDPKSRFYVIRAF